MYFTPLEVALCILSLLCRLKEVRFDGRVWKYSHREDRYEKEGCKTTRCCMHWPYQTHVGRACEGYAGVSPRSRRKKRLDVVVGASSPESSEISPDAAESNRSDVTAPPAFTDTSALFCEEMSIYRLRRLLSLINSLCHPSTPTIRPMMLLWLWSQPLLCPWAWSCWRAHDYTARWYGQSSV